MCILHAYILVPVESLAGCIFMAILLLGFLLFRDVNVAQMQLNCYLLMTKPVGTMRFDNTSLLITYKQYGPR